jgi:DNA modification methylase
MTEQDFTNKLIPGDNLDVLRTIPDESADLVCLDPPTKKSESDTIHKKPKRCLSELSRVRAMKPTLFLTPLWAAAQQSP